jgi:hypothetical protein
MHREYLILYRLTHLSTTTSMIGVIRILVILTIWHQSRKCFIAACWNKKRFKDLNFRNIVRSIGVFLQHWWEGETILVHQIRDVVRKYKHVNWEISSLPKWILLRKCILWNIIFQVPPCPFQFLILLRISSTYAIIIPTLFWK